MSGFSAAEPVLPLIHTTTTNGYRLVLEQDAVKAPKPCSVFKEKVVYLFYGRPA